MKVSELSEACTLAAFCQDVHQKCSMFPFVTIVALPYYENDVLPKEANLV